MIVFKKNLGTLVSEYNKIYQTKRKDQVDQNKSFKYTGYSVNRDKERNSVKSQLEKHADKVRFLQLVKTAITSLHVLTKMNYSERNQCKKFLTV